MLLLYINNYFSFHSHTPAIFFHFMFQNQDGSTTTFNEYDVESDEAFHNNNHHHKSHTVNFRTPTLANSTTSTKKVNNNNNNNNQNSNQNNSSLSPRLESPL